MTIWAPQIDLTLSAKYRAIAAGLEADIASGKLPPATQLPTMRALARQLKVTVGTVGRAYALAHEKGLISTEVGRGTFILGPGQRRISTGDESTGTIDLGLNLPPPLPSQEPFRKAIARLSAHRELWRLFDCAPVDSCEAYRVAAAQWIANRMECGPESVLICAGTQNALIASLSTLAKPGDSILVESLTFPGLRAAAKLLHLNLVPIAIDEQGLVPEALDAQSDQADVLYCIPTNHSATTATQSIQRRRAIAKVIDQRGIHVIEDDVYGMLLENAPPPLVSLVPNTGLLICSLAKSMSVGLRLAYLRFPISLRNKLVEQLRATQFFPPMVSVEIATDWIEDGTAIGLVEQFRIAAQLRQSMAAELLGSDRIAGTPRLNHGWHRLPESWSPQRFANAAQGRGVVVYPASVFAANNGTTTNAVRVAIGAPRTMVELRRGLEQLATLLDCDSTATTARY